MFNHVSDFHSYNTRNLLSLRGEFARTNYRRFSIFCHGPNVWNKLPPDITQSINYHTFKKKLYNWFLYSSYNYILFNYYNASLTKFSSPLGALSYNYDYY